MSCWEDRLEGGNQDAYTSEEDGSRPVPPSGESIPQKHIEAVEASFYAPDDDVTICASIISIGSGVVVVL